MSGHPHHHGRIEQRRRVFDSSAKRLRPVEELQRQIVLRHARVDL